MSARRIDSLRFAADILGETERSTCEYLTSRTLKSFYFLVADGLNVDGLVIDACDEPRRRPRRRSPKSLRP